MKTLRLFTFLVLTALTSLSPMDSVWSAPPPDAFLSEADAGGQVSGTMPNSRAGLMTLQGLSGRNELTYGAIPWVGLEGNWGDNYQRQDYYTLDAFLPYNVNPGTDFFFSGLGLSLTEQGRAAGNVGLGYGYYLQDFDRLLRFSSWLTVDGQYEKTRSGIGLNFENLGKYVDVRGEIFGVLSDSTDLVNRGLTGQSGFSGNRYLIQGVGIRETAFHHADLEIGGPLAYLGDYGISAYAKGYYLFNTQNDQDSVGYGVRGEWSITEDVTFNVNYTSDDIFDEATWFTLAMTTPDGAPRNFARPISVRERFSKAVVRDKRIRTNIETERFNVPLLNPKTGNAYRFAHVNPNRTDGTGNGTFEAPFGSVDTLINNGLAPFDAIYTRPRTDDTATNLTVMDPGGVAPALTPLLLMPNQMLLGSTIDQTIDVLPQPFLPGSTFTIPALDPGLNAPILMNGDIGANAIVYASRGNLISGLTFDGSGIHDGIRLDGNAILGDMILDGIGQDLHVRNNTFQNTNIGVNAPDLSDGIPTPLCTLLGHSTLWNNTFTGNTVGFDIQIDSTNDAMPNDTLDGTMLTLSILGNTVNSNVNGGAVTAQGPGVTVDLAARDIDGDGVTDPVLAGNDFSDNSAGGLALGADLGGLMLVDVGADPGNIPDPGLGPIAPFNTFSGNGDYGLQIEATSDDATGAASIIRGNIIANDFNDQASGGDGLELIADGDTNTLAFLDFGTTAASPVVPVLSGANALLGAFSGTIDLNTFDRENSGDRGVVVDLLDGSGDFNFTRNSFVGGNASVGAGLDATIEASPLPNGNASAQMLLTVGGPLAADGNLFDSNADAGIRLAGAGFFGVPPAQLDRSFFWVTNNVISNTTGDGILIQRENSSLFTAVIGNGTPQNGGGNLIQDNSGAGIQFTSENGTDQAGSIGMSNATPFIYFDDNTIDGNGIGFNVDMNADGAVQVFGVTNAITNTFLSAVDINTNNNSAFGLPAQPLTGEDLNNDGLLQPWEDLNFDGSLQLAGPTVLSSVFDSNLVQNFGVDGFWMTAADDSFQDIRISGTQLANPLNPNSFIRTLIDGGGGFAFDGIHIDADSAPDVFMPRGNQWTIQGVDITGIGNDGILYISTAGDNTITIGAPFNGANVVIDGAGNDGLGVFAGGAASDTFYVNNLGVMNSGSDGAEILQTSSNELLFNMTESSFLNNTETGFTADVQSTSFVSVFNIGTEERDGANGILDGTNEDANMNGLLDAGEDLNGNGILDSGEDVDNDGMLGIVGNEFNGNNHQGFYFQTFSTLTGDANVAGSFISEDPQDVQTAGETGLYASPGNTSVNVFSRLNFYGNQVISNGTPATQADGMVLGVGTNTFMAAAVDGNIFGGNTLDDFSVVTIVSQNPEDSQNNVLTAPNRDRIRWDPVAFLDLAFGENFASNPPRTFLLDNPNGPGIGNTGDSISIDTIGNNSSVIGRTETGVFTNSDIVKPANRSALSVINVYVTAPADLDGSNSFSQQPSIETVFNNAIFSNPVRFFDLGGVVDPAYATVNFINAAFP